METQMTKYPDPIGYDAEGYGLSTGLHKRWGLRRYFRTGIDSPISAAEQTATTLYEEGQARDATKMRACFERRPATEERPEGGHRVRWVSHDGQECIDCGAYFCVPDMD